MKGEDAPSFRSSYTVLLREDHHIRPTGRQPGSDAGSIEGVGMLRALSSGGMVENFGV